MFDISDEKYEELRLILGKQNGYEYTFENAKEVGDELVDFYRLLLRLDDKDTGEGSDCSAVKPTEA